MRTSTSQPAVSLGSVCLRYSSGGVIRRASLDARHQSAGFQRQASLTAFPAGPAMPGRTSGGDPLARLESVLFLAKEPLNSRKLAQFAGLEDGTQARTLIERLNAQYDESGRAFRVEEIAGGYQLLTRRKFSGWLRRLAHVPGELRLSAPSLETLAVIAYRQPVLKADIDAIRGVNCGEILRQLMERDLVRISGRSEELGRPFLYVTTRRFLNVFGLHNLSDLPRAEAIRNAPVMPGPPLALLAADGEGASPSGQEPAPEYTVDDDGSVELEDGEFESGNMP
jgi:segregation and condensation protein B